MPELPEVEIIANQLRPIVEGRVLAEMLVLRPDYIKGIAADHLTTQCMGHRVIAVRRVGKALLLDWDEGGSLCIRLGMSGRVLVEKKTAELVKHTHWILRFDTSDVEIRGVDPRRFGSLSWIVGEKPANMGTDALVLKPEELMARFSGRKMPIHSALLDQRILAGVGNIYACEALYKAQIDPATSTGLLSLEECCLLMEKLHDVMKRSIATGGSTIADYVDVGGNMGHFADEHCVYGRENQVCPKCGGLIKRARKGGRSIYYCPGCQCSGSKA